MSCLWIVVEKIFVFDEVMCIDWGVDGISGYDFMNQVGVLLYDVCGELFFIQGWFEWIGVLVVEVFFLVMVVFVCCQILYVYFVVEFDVVMLVLYVVVQQNCSSYDMMWYVICCVFVEVIVYFFVYCIYVNV